MTEPIEDKPNRLVKNLKVSLRTHKEMAHASTDTGKAMYELIDEAWECWKAAQAGSTAAARSSTDVPSIDSNVTNAENYQVDDAWNAIEKIGHIVSKTLEQLHKTKANPRNRGRRAPTRHRTGSDH